VGAAEVFDVIVVDFPDPTNFAIGKLYTNSFYALLDKRLAASGYAVVQTTSPLIARKSFWTVAHTIESVGLRTTPYHAHVPSFGEWGFIIAAHRPGYTPPQAYRVPLKFLDREATRQMFFFPPDMQPWQVEPNQLNDQRLVHYFEQDWSQVIR